MARRLRLNLILLIVVGLLGLLVWRAQPPGFPPLTPLDPSQIDRIEISHLSARQIVLRKQAGIWRSGSVIADQQRITQLLGICDTPSLERFTAPSDLTPFGLDPAPTRVLLNGLTLEFGATDPVNGWRYVRIGKQIHLIADGFYHHLTAPLSAWQESP